MNGQSDSKQIQNERFHPRRITWFFGGLFFILFALVLLSSLTSVAGSSPTSFTSLVFQLAAIGMAVVGVVFGFLIVRRINRRLARLATVADSIGKGDYTARSDDKGSDAISLLASTINQMAEQIDTSIRELERQRTELEDRERRLEEQNQQLTREYRRRETFGEYLTAINTVDLEEIAARALDYLMPVAHAQLGVFFLNEGEGGRLRRIAGSGLDRVALDHLAPESPDSGMPVEVIRRREWITIGDIEEGVLPTVALGIGNARIRTVVGIPVLFQKNALGVIILAALHRIDDKTRTALENAVEALGSAVNNAITYKTVQHQALRLEQANQELLEVDRLRSEFVANMSHELRTPLNSIIGFSNLLAKNRNRTLKEADLNFVEKINRNGKHLLGLINDILDLSKIEAGRMQLEILPTSIGEVVGDVVDMLQTQAEAKHLSFTRKVVENLPLVACDGDKLKQVLINLAGNAIKFTHEGGVTVHAVSDGPTHVQIRIADTGIGIPAEKLDEIFEPFRQADSSTTREYGGTGLGLSISRAIVELLGGNLTAESTEGKGSEFNIRLPTGGGGSAPKTTGEGTGSPDEEKDPPVEHPALPTRDGLQLEPGDKSPPSDSAAVQNTAASGRGRGAVLVVDDEQDARDLLATQIADLGVPVVTCGSGEDALRVAADIRPALITLDLMMPVMDGWEVLRRLKQDPALADIPVIIVSMVAERRRAVILGAVDALAKPIVKSQLHGLLRRYVGNE